MRHAIFHQHRYAAELDRLVTPTTSWLDVGAGRKLHDGWEGASCETLAKRARHLVGCDVVDDVLRNPYLHEAKIASAYELPFAAESFDLVSANMVVEHLESPARAFVEVFRVLKPGGAFVFVTPNLAYPIIRAASLLAPPWLRRRFAIAFSKRAAADTFVTWYRCNTVADIRELAATTGFAPDTLEAFHNSETILPGVAGELERHLDKPADLIAVLRRPARA